MKAIIALILSLALSWNLGGVPLQRQAQFNINLGTVGNILQQVLNGSSNSHKSSNSQHDSDNDEDSPTIGSDNSSNSKGSQRYSSVSSSKCAKCHKTISGKKHYLNGSYVCKSCLEKNLPKCCCCHKKITQGYVEYFDGNYACLSCYKKNLPRCSECNCPVNSSISPCPEKGVYTCDKHRSGAILQVSAAEDVADEVLDAYDEVFDGAFELIALPTIHMETLDELQTLGKSNNEWIKAFSKSHQQGSQYSHDIYLVKGMNHDYLFEQIAHEMAHCWHYENQPVMYSCNSQFREGFAEWVAYKTLAKLGDSSQCQRQRQRQLDNVVTDYSEGLQKFLALEKKLGSAAAVLDYVKENNKL